MSRFFGLFIGFVLLSAGIYRIFSFSSALTEMESLKLPALFAPAVIILEIACGGLLIINKLTQWALSAIALFLAIALTVAFIVDGKKILSSAGELFVFNATATDVFLHVTYLVIVVALLVNHFSRKK